MNTLTFSKLFHIRAVPSSARWPIQRLSSGGELLRHLWLVAAASSQQYGSGVLVTKGVSILPPHLRSKCRPVAGTLMLRPCPTLSYLVNSQLANALCIVTTAAVGTLCKRNSGRPSKGNS